MTATEFDVPLPPLSAGQRYTWPKPVGSADALLLARMALRECTQGRRMAIVTADARDAQREDDGHREQDQDDEDRRRQEEHHYILLS